MFAVHRTRNPNIPGDLIAHKLKTYSIYISLLYSALFAIVCIGFCSKTVCWFLFLNKVFNYRKRKWIMCKHRVFFFLNYFQRQTEQSEQLKTGGFLRTCAVMSHTFTFLCVSKAWISSHSVTFPTFFSSSEKIALPNNQPSNRSTSFHIRKYLLKNDKIKLFPIKRFFYVTFLELFILFT